MSLIILTWHSLLISSSIIFQMVFVTLLMSWGTTEVQVLAVKRTNTSDLEFQLSAPTSRKST